MVGELQAAQGGGAQGPAEDAGCAQPPYPDPYPDPDPDPYPYPYPDPYPYPYPHPHPHPVTSSC